LKVAHWHSVRDLRLHEEPIPAAGPDVGHEFAGVTEVCQRVAVDPE